MTTAMYTREPLATPGNEELAVQKYIQREDAPRLYDACVGFMRECFKDWDAGIPTLTIQEYDGELIGFLAGYRAAQSK